MSGRAFSFGDFRLLPEERTLLESGKPVRISSRALDLLTILVDHPGELLSKKQLIAHAWPNTRVEENNLRVHIGTLRKLLGESPAGVSYIATIPGRGYSFVGHVVAESAPSLLATVPVPITPGLLPAPVTRMIGRTETLDRFLSRMRTERLVTIVGPGGIGKTTLALAVAERLRGLFEHRAAFVDLSPLADPQVLPSALASVLGVPTHAECPLDGLVALLREKRVLIVLDSCEHLVEAAATMTEALLKGAPGVQILATSREALEIEGEWVEQLEPLGTPDSVVGLTAAQALAFPALQLFAERAATRVEGFTLSDKDVPAAVEICQKLDGIPLAIELAAARVGVFGISGLAERLNDRLAVLTRGRRTAPPRHKTLRAMLDWSYCLLSAREQEVLNRLAIFAGEFALDSANAVAASAEEPSANVAETMASLVSKSLVTAVLRNGAPLYRLLDTTRAYAREKLLQGAHFHMVAKLHGENLCAALEALRASPGPALAAELTSIYKPMVDDIRAALRWCFAPAGDAHLGIKLTAAATSLFMRLSLLDECRGHVERVLRDEALVAMTDPLAQMRLNLALGHLLLHTSRAESELTDAFERALTLAEQLGAAAPRAEALAAAWIGSTRCAEYRKALDYAQRLQPAAEAAASPVDLAHARMLAIPLHYMGEFAASSHVIERALGDRRKEARVAHDQWFYVDFEVAMRAIDARNTWLLGFQDRASELARHSLERALSISHAAGICYALVTAACPVALWRGDWAEARRLTSMLRVCSSEYSLRSWATWVPFYEQVLLSRSTPTSRPVDLTPFDTSELDVHQIDELATFGEGALPREALTRVESGRIGWNAAEILRLSGEHLLKERGAHVASSVEATYLRSLEIARRQGALSWELRTATSIACLWKQRNREREGRELLAEVLGRFTEGYQTADHAKSGKLLQELSASG